MVKKPKIKTKSILIILFLAMIVFCSCSSGSSSLADNKTKPVDYNENEEYLEQSLSKNAQNELLNPIDKKAESGGIERFEPKFNENLSTTETPGENQSPMQTATPTKAPTLIATARLTKTIAATKTDSPIPTKTALPELTEFTCPEGCTEQKPGCNIKGNISIKTKEKIYHMIGQQNYEQTVISPENGERWFCTEEEAIANGWRKAKR